MKHTIYLRQVGCTLMFFSLVVFSGCDFLKKVQKKYWPNENKQVDNSQEGVLNANSVSVMEKCDTLSDINGEILGKSSEQENNDKKEKNDTSKEEVDTQPVTYTGTLLTQLCDSNRFGIERKNIIATLIISNPNWIDSIERNGLEVTQALSMIDREINRAQVEAQRQAHQRIWLFSLIRRYRVNSFEEANIQGTGGYTLAGSTEVEPVSSQQGTTLEEALENQMQHWQEKDQQEAEKGEEAPDLLKQWGKPGCPICRDTDTANTIVIPCQTVRKDRHIFHIDCIKNSIAAQYRMQEEEGLPREATCPICRAKIL